jgi:hypothetical protein
MLAIGALVNVYSYLIYSYLSLSKCPGTSRCISRASFARASLATRLTAHPLEPRPNRVEVVCAWQAADVVEASVRAPIFDQGETCSFTRATRRLAAPGTMLGGSGARSVAAGALLALVPQARNRF